MLPLPPGAIAEPAVADMARVARADAAGFLPRRVKESAVDDALLLRLELRS